MDTEGQKVKNKEQSLEAHSLDLKLSSAIFAIMKLTQLNGH